MGRPKSTHCKNGHDVALIGRVANGQCRACYYSRNRDYAAEWRQRKGSQRMPLLRRTYLPIDPLVPFVAYRRDRLNAKVLDRFAAAKSRGVGRVTVELADEICTALGYHPSEIFGELWWQEATG